jgi:hypothetical protein
MVIKLVKENKISIRVVKTTKKEIHHIRSSFYQLRQIIFTHEILLMN